MKSIILGLFLLSACAAQQQPQIVLPSPTPCPEPEPRTAVLVQCWHTAGLVVLELQEHADGTPNIIPQMVESLGCRCELEIDEVRLVTVDIVDPEICKDYPMKSAAPNPNLEVSDEQFRESL